VSPKDVVWNDIGGNLGERGGANKIERRNRLWSERGSKNSRRR